MPANFHLVQSLIKSLAIIDVLSESVDGMGITEMSERIGLNKSTVHRISSTLVHEGFVEQDQRKGVYRLSPKLFELARKILNNIRPAKIVGPHLEKLARATGESACYVVIDKENARLIVSDEVMTPKPIKVRSQLGESLSLSGSAPGKMFLASLSDGEIKEIMDEKGRKSVLRDEKATFATLRKDLGVIREKGFVYETLKKEEEPICHVAAPVRNEHGTIIGAVDVYAPAYRWPKEKAGRIGDLVKEAALEISKKLGFIPV